MSTPNEDPQEPTQEKEFPETPELPAEFNSAYSFEEGSKASWPAPEEVVHTKEGSLAWRALGLIKTIRPHQWVKNVFVLAPVVFAKNIFNTLLLLQAGAAFFAFCLLAGAVYTMNDLADVAADREHPVKRHRPIASGRVTEQAARAFAGLLVVTSLGLGIWAGGVPFFGVLLGYFALNVAYTMKLKHVAYLDVACISAGFVLRVLGGGLATHISVTWYLFACTALLALFLGFGKRRHELTTAAARSKARTRAALEGYTKGGLDFSLIATSLLTVVVYVTYTLDSATRAFFKSDYLWATTIFVAAGIARFVHIVRHRPKAESPTQEMLSDGFMVAVVLLWITVVFFLVYHLRPTP
jgi:4-hydroxybenzoate polyprenyltransferase